MRLALRRHKRISIHTPAKGVTRVAALCDRMQLISIHTPAKGVTHCHYLPVVSSFNFNPHSREGSDKTESCVAVLTMQISIHTPAKGVTVEREVSEYKVIISIHTPAKGVTPLLLCDIARKGISIHTPAKGVTYGVRI